MNVMVTQKENILSAVDELLIANILLVPSFSRLASDLEAALCYIRGRAPPAREEAVCSVSL